MKLHYFDIYGRAESIRFLLSHAKIKYENVLINNDTLKDLKASGNLEFGQLPMLETEDGKHLCQSWAILRFLGRKYGYYPDEAEIAWKIDSCVDAVEDYLNAYFKFNFESNEERKAQFKENWLKMLPEWIAAIEKRITSNGGKYVAGDKITIADFALAAVGFNMLFNEANMHYADSWGLVKDREVLIKYTNLLKESLGEHLAKRNQPRPF
jgi:glutathione S-transferase